MLLRPGDRVALLLPGSVEYAEVVLGLLQSGVVPVPLDPRLTEAERSRLLPYVEPAVVVTDDGGLADLAHRHPWQPDAVPLARPMHLTSGTTGSPGHGSGSPELSVPDGHSGARIRCMWSGAGARCNSSLLEESAHEVVAATVT